MENPKSSHQFKVFVTAATGLFTVVGLLVFANTDGFEFNPVAVSVFPLSVLPIVIYWIGLTRPSTVRLVGLIMLATIVPAWLVFLIRTDSQFRGVYVLPAALVGIVATTIASLMERRR